MSASNSGHLRDKVMKGLGWVGASQLMLQIIRMIGAIVVARLLVPEEYGLAMLALVFTSLVLVFSDFALGAALVQRKELSEADRSTAFWLTLISGVVFTVVGVALSGPVASLYGQPDVKPLLVVLSLSFVLTSLGATQQSLLLRDMAFARSEMIGVAATLVSTIVAVVLAAMGAGAWAIIGQQLAAAVVQSILFWFASPWRPQLQVSRASARDLFGFSGWLVGHRLLFYVHQNADRLIIGRFIGASAVGVYAVAYNIMLAPASRIAGPVQRVVAPAFARMQDEPERMAAAWARVTRMVGVVIIPALAGIIVVAPDFVPVVLGDQWRSASTVIQILAWVGMLQALQAVNVDVLMARDRTSVLFRYMIFFCIAHVIAFASGLHWGVVGIATAYAISSTLVEPVLTVLTARTLGVSPFTTVRAVSGVALAALLMALGVLAARLLLIDAGVGPTMRLVICCAVGLVLYLPLCAWRAPDVTRELRLMLAGRVPRLRHTVAAR